MREGASLHVCTTVCDIQTTPVCLCGHEHKYTLMPASGYLQRAKDVKES